MAGSLDDGNYITESSLSIVASRATVKAQDGVFTSTLSVGGSVTLSGTTLTTSAVRVLDGAAVAPTLAYSSEASLGFFRSGNSTLQLSYGVFASPLFVSTVTAATSATTALQTVQGSLRFSVLSLTSNGGQMAFRSGNTTYIFSSTAVG